eukprot:1474628-Prymnesium_polylepis.1
MARISALPGTAAMAHGYGSRRQADGSGSNTPLASFVQCFGQQPLAPRAVSRRNANIGKWTT